MKHVGGTGTRYQPTRPQLDAMVKVLTDEYDPAGTTLHIGDCTGADKVMGIEARKIGYILHGHPPTIDSWRAFLEYDIVSEPLPYLDRNKVIVKSSGLLIAMPYTPGLERSGTWHTIGYAVTFNKTMIIILPAGAIVNNREDVNTHG